MMIRLFVFAAFALFLIVTSLSAATYNVVDYGATPNDDSDDTIAIAKALAACGETSGGTVFVPSGTFIITRQGAESPILALPSNTTIHVEHARGLQNVQIIANRCRKSILAGGVDGLLIRDNVITGRIEGNGNTNFIVAGNIVRGAAGATRALMQFGYADGLIIRDNILRVAPDATQAGLYIWGKSKYNANPSRDVIVSGNLIASGDTGISLNGIDGVTIGPNRIRVPEGKKTIKVSRGENVVMEQTSVLQGSVGAEP